MSGDAVLAVRGVTRSFGGIQAVAEVDLDVERQEIVGLIGPNGSGKSTLFNLIAGAAAPDSGSIRFQGIDITGEPAYRIARRGMGRTFQIPSLFENMSVMDNLLAGAVEGAWRGAAARAREALELLELRAVRDHLASELSGGQQKLLELARLFMRQPTLLLLDEVTAGVHVNIRRIILDAVTRMRGEGATFIVIEHDMELIKTVCDRIVVMDSGRVVASGGFDDIAGNSEVMQAYLGRRA